MISNYHSEIPLNKTRTWLFFPTPWSIYIPCCAWFNKKERNLFFLFFKDFPVQAVFDNAASLNWHIKRHFEVGHTIKMTIFYVKMCFSRLKERLTCFTGVYSLYFFSPNAAFFKNYNHYILTQMTKKKTVGPIALIWGNSSLELLTNNSHMLCLCLQGMHCNFFFSFFLQRQPNKNTGLCWVCTV